MYLWFYVFMMETQFYFLRSEGTALCLNAREVAPAASTVDMFQGNDSLSSDSSLSVAVPGEIAGYWEAR